MGKDLLGVGVDLFEFGDRVADLGVFEGVGLGFGEPAHLDFFIFKNILYFRRASELTN